MACWSVWHRRIVVGVWKRPESLVHRSRSGTRYAGRDVLRYLRRIRAIDLHTEETKNRCSLIRHPGSTRFGNNATSTSRRSKPRCNGGWVDLSVTDPVATRRTLG